MKAEDKKELGQVYETFDTKNRFALRVRKSMLLLLGKSCFSSKDKPDTFLPPKI
jgi:hypothetical protein